MLLLSHHRTLTPKFHEPGKNESDLMFYVTLWAMLLRFCPILEVEFPNF